MTRYCLLGAFGHRRVVEAMFGGVAAGCCRVAWTPGLKTCMTASDAAGQA